MDNGKENGNYYNGLYRGYIGIPFPTNNHNQQDVCMLRVIAFGGI